LDLDAYVESTYGQSRTLGSKEGEAMSKIIAHELVLLMVEKGWPLRNALQFVGELSGEQVKAIWDHGDVPECKTLFKWEESLLKRKLLQKKVRK